MNVIGSYQHHHLMHDTFPFVPRGPQEPYLHRRGPQEPYLHSWGSQVYPAEALYGAPPGAPDAPPEGLSARGRRGPPGPKKERRRTESINTAFAELRERIPNVPADTKLSKIKTLRLATSYICYLMDVLAADRGPADRGAEGPDGFRADLKKGPDVFREDLKKGPDGFRVDLKKGPDGFRVDLKKGPDGFRGDLKKGPDGFREDLKKGPDGFRGDLKKLDSRETKRKRELVGC